MHRGKRAIAALAALVAIAGCGARVNSSLRTEAADAALGRSGGTGGGVIPGSGPGSASSQVGANSSAADNAAQSSSGPTPAAGQTVNGTGPSSGPVGATATTLGAQSPGAGCSGISGPGVTATTITLGNVADLSGPVPGLFQGAVTGTKAYLNFVNSQGGVCGHQLQLLNADSQTDCAPTENAYSDLVGKVFAFAGSFDLYDDCGAQVMNQHPTVPDVSYKLTAQGVAEKNDFSVDAIPPGGYYTGPFVYWAAKFGSAVQHVGTIYPNIPASSIQAQGQMKAAESVGWKFVYQRQIGATETNYTTDVIAMQQAGVKVVYTDALNVTEAVNLIQEIRQQNWNPIIILPPVYAQNFFQLLGGSSQAEGIWGQQPYSMFFNASDAQNLPEDATFLSWMHKTNPSLPVDLFAMYGWAETAMLVQAMRAAGSTVNQAGVMAALETVHQYTDGNMVGSADPAAKKPTQCYVLFQVHSGQFVRVDTPANGFRCDGGYVYP